MTMTETNTNVDESALPAPVQDAIRNARIARDEVERITNRLGLAANASDVVKRNFAANQLVEQFKGDEKFSKIQKTVDSFAESFPGDDLMVAAYTQIRKALVDKYGEKVKTVLDEKAKDIKSEPLSQDEQNTLVEERATQAQLYKAYKSIVTAMGQKLPSDLTADISIRRGGPRGPEVQGSYQFRVETKEGSGTYLEPTDKLSVLANTTLKDLNWRTADLKKFLVENVTDAVAGKDSDGKDILTLPNNFEVKLPAPLNRILKADLTSTITAPDDEENEDEVSEDALES